MLEVWKEIEGYNGRYMVSDQGRVKSLLGNAKILKANKGGGPYHRVTLNMNRKFKHEMVHVLVAIVFMGHKKCGKKVVVDHINNIKDDNRVCNLQIISQRANSTKNRRNKTGYTGVRDRGNRYESSIMVDGKDRHLGSFRSALNASKAYQRALWQIENWGSLPVELPKVSRK